jgi:hypothetical protein
VYIVGLQNREFQETFRLFILFLRLFGNTLKSVKK